MRDFKEKEFAQKEKKKVCETQLGGGRETVTTSVLLVTELPLWCVVAGDGGKYSNAHPDGPKREGLS